MIQSWTLDGSMFSGVVVPKHVESLAVSGHLPNGLIGLDLETGLVEVQLDPHKTTKMRYGKLLKKLGMDESCIPLEAAKASTIYKLYKGAEIKYARVQEEILDVYRNGPRSCMMNDESVACYASPDLAVAYVEVDGRVVARAVVAPDKKIRARIYGDETLLGTLLEIEGYDKGNLEGCRLLRIEDDEGNLLCPYLDCGTRAYPDDDYILITCCGEYGTQNEPGILRLEVCDGCEEPCPDDERCYCEHREMSLCDSCYDEGMVCVNGQYYHEDSGEVKQTGDGDWIMESEAVYSEHHGEYFHQDDVTYSEQDGDDFKNSEIIDAWVGEEYEPEPCFKGNCVWVRGTPVHEEFEEDYRKLNGIGEDICPDVKQGTLRLTDTKALMIERSTV